MIMHFRKLVPSSCILTVLFLSACAQDYQLAVIPKGSPSDGTVGTPDLPGSVGSPTQSTGSNLTMVTDSHVASREEQKIDLLFIIDNSPSMADDQDNLANSFNVFIQNFVQKDLDFHIGIVSTDMTADGSYWDQGASQVFNGYAGAAPGRLLSRTSERYLTSTSQDLVNKFKNNVRLGDQGAVDEKGLLSATLALSSGMARGSGYNAGFIRDDAHLAIIHVTDEEETLSGDSTSTRLNTFLNVVRSAKNNEVTHIRMDAIVDLNASSLIGSAVQTFNGSKVSITSNFSSTLDQLGADIVGSITSRFALSRVAYGSMSVTVNGVTVPQSTVQGWSYDPASNEVELRGSYIPNAGAEVKIVYGTK